MNKKFLCIITLLATLITFNGCKVNNEQKNALHEFNQVTTVNGAILYGAGPYNYSVTDYDEILCVFARLKESGTLNRYVYAFNALADGVSLKLGLNSYVLNGKKIDEITNGQDFIKCSGIVNINLSLWFDNTTCTFGDEESDTEAHAEHITLIFDKTQPEPPSVVNNSYLSYREAELGRGYSEHYYYEILYNGKLLFYIKSCNQLSDDSFNELFVNSLVQYDTRENKTEN